MLQQGKQILLHMEVVKDSYVSYNLIIRYQVRLKQMELCVPSKWFLDIEMTYCQYGFIYFQGHNFCWYLIPWTGLNNFCKQNLWKICNVLNVWICGSLVSTVIGFQQMIMKSQYIDSKPSPNTSLCWQHQFKSLFEKFNKRLLYLIFYMFKFFLKATIQMSHY